MNNGNHFGTSCFCLGRVVYLRPCLSTSTGGREVETSVLFLLWGFCVLGTIWMLIKGGDSDA